MRDIRFRAWLPISKEMVVFGLPHINYEYGVLAMGTNQEKYSGIANMPDDYKQAVFMQFTGLYDKNGKEIYEGDILKCERDYWETPRNLVVEWNEDCWSLLKTDDPVDSEVLNHNSSFNVPEYQREVIGNIYENPELAGRTE